MPGEWIDLPVEIWLYIVDRYHNTREIAKLCSTCRQNLALFRPILYRDLVLKAETSACQPNDAVADTLELLSRDKALASHVRALTLDATSYSENYYRNPNLIHIRSLENMTQLKRVTLVGDLSRNASPTSVDVFIQILAKLCLDEISFPSPGARTFLLARNWDQLRKLGKAKKTVFYCRLLSLKFAALLTTKPATVSDLHISAPFTLVSDLFALHLPRLRVLELRIVETRQRPLSPSGFNAFLASHNDTLEELSMLRNSPNEALQQADLRFEPNNRSLGPDFLPKLKVLRGNSENLFMLVRARSTCLSRLECLAIGWSRDHAEEATHTLLSALEERGPFSNLIDFDFAFAPRASAAAPKFLQSIVRFFPSLAIWRGDLPLETVQTIPVIMDLKQLRVLHIRDVSGTQLVRSEWLESIPSLDSVIVRHNPQSVSKSVYVMKRDRLGRFQLSYD
ncbi:unnamed protein product [Mycena citricolor]|uniref:Uncharacterized protein n=1 Tax=Mycena citricolor TaxID=2018698 RepID=A0AAD2HC94_9AGAR|nr:unnamed protein product [Mycena citricolor]